MSEILYAIQDADGDIVQVRFWDGTSPINIPDGATATPFQNLSEEQKEYAKILFAVPENNSETKYNALEWLSLQGIGGDRQPTLLYLRQSLSSASKQSAKLNETESYLQNVLAIYASDPSPRSDWSKAPYTFDDVVQECVSILNQ